MNNYIYNSKDFAHYLFQYRGKYANELNDENMAIFIIDREYGIVSVKLKKFTDIGDTGNIYNMINNKAIEKGIDFNVVFVVSYELYTLQEISAIEAANVSFLQTNTPLNLTGKGVAVAIIDTGIDYLNNEFRDLLGKTRIKKIWDQTDLVNKNNSDAPFGTIYNKYDINMAIDAYEVGENPYDIVAIRDENGHGTNMAGIVGAFGKNPEIKGIAPECEFIIVKLIEDIFYKANGNINNPVYNLTSIVAALEFINREKMIDNSPVVVLFPLGTNNGNHKVNNILNEFIEIMSSKLGIVVVTGSGNEGIADGHVYGRIISEDGEELVELIVAEGQKHLFFEVWVTIPGIVEMNLISPSGQDSGMASAALNSKTNYTYVFETTTVKIYYYLADQYSGEQLIRVYLFDVEPGIWRILLKLKLGYVAEYNIWLQQKALIGKNTRFTPSDPYGTVTIPGDSDYIITVAAYNQNNNNILPYSGVSFRNEYLSKIDFAAGGVNTKTVGLNNKTDIINGTSLSAAIGAGACILLFEWAVIKGNYPTLYSQSIRTFLQRGTTQRQADKYPNPQLGYGIIDFYKIFYNISYSEDIL